MYSSVILIIFLYNLQNFFLSCKMNSILIINFPLLPFSSLWQPTFFLFELFDCLLFFSHSVVSNSLQPQGLFEPFRLLCPWDSPGKKTGMGCHSLLQEIFLTQRLSLCLLHWQMCSLSLSHLGNFDHFRYLMKVE